MTAYCQLLRSRRSGLVHDERGRVSQRRLKRIAATRRKREAERYAASQPLAHALVESHRDGQYLLEAYGERYSVMAKLTRRKGEEVAVVSCMLRSQHAPFDLDALEVLAVRREAAGDATLRQCLHDHVEIVFGPHLHPGPAVRGRLRAVDYPTPQKRWLDAQRRERTKARLSRDVDRPSTP
jgi:hypothetical protein